MVSILTTLITVLGSIVVAVIANNKRDERKLMILEKLGKALKDDQSTKLEVAELFRLATGIRMRYSDIKSIVNDENCIWLVHILNKTPGYVKYENGKLYYSEMFAKAWIKRVADIIDRMALIFSMIVYFTFAVAFALVSTLAAKGIIAIFLCVSALWMVANIREWHYNSRIKELVQIGS